MFSDVHSSPNHCLASSASRVCSRHDWHYNVVRREKGEDSTYFEDVHSRLEKFSKNIWDEIQRRVSVLLSSFPKLHSIKVVVLIAELFLPV